LRGRTGENDLRRARALSHDAYEDGLQREEESRGDDENDAARVVSFGRRSHRRARQARPPSTERTCPVIQPDCSEAKNRTAQAISSGVPRRRVKMPSTRRFWPSGP
jgi:hypothetical protein